VRRSPDSPTEMLRTSLSIFNSRMGFELLSLPSAILIDGGFNECDRVFGERRVVVVGERRRQLTEILGARQRLWRKDHVLAH
jgi:hypothetical protein